MRFLSFPALFPSFSPSSSRFPHLPPACSFTHTGVDKVAAAYSSATGQITLRPIPVKGLDASKVKTRRSNRTHFTPRISHFDRHNTTSQQDPFRGFWVLFWMMVFLGALRTLTRHWMETGSPFGVQFATLISEDGWALALSDGVMVLATFACVVFAKVRPLLLLSSCTRLTLILAAHREWLDPILLDRSGTSACRTGDLLGCCSEVDFPSVRFSHSVSSPPSSGTDAPACTETGHGCRAAL